MRSNHALLIGACSLPLVLTACTGNPTPAQIELVSMDASQRGDFQAEQRLVDWAARGVPVAQRELALLYSHRPSMTDVAQTLLQRAATRGDAEAAFQMGELDRARNVPDRATQWYRQAAALGHPKAALALGLMFKNGTGVPVDRAQAVHWLGSAAHAGNAQAMFLMSNAYADGDGIAADTKKSRRLLEQAADLEYPPAMQRLAFIKENGDAPAAADSAESNSASTGF